MSVDRRARPDPLICDLRAPHPALVTTFFTLMFTFLYVAGHAESPGPPARDARVRTLSNKLTLLERLVGNSPTVARAVAIGETAVLEILTQARGAHALAREHFSTGDYDTAEASIDQAFQLLAKASRILGGPRKSNAEERQEYAALQERVASFTDALERVYDEKGIDSASERADLQILHQGIEEARTLAQSEDYRDANRALRGIADIVEIALTRARHQETLLHALKFASPEEEYAYEAGRNRSYEMLITLLRNRQGAVGDPKKQQFLNEIVKRNDAVREKADTLAANGDIAGAIEHLERGTDRLANALRALGLSF